MRKTRSIGPESRKKAFVWAAALACWAASGLLLPGCTREAPKPEVGRSAPDFELATLDGSKVRLSSFKDKVVFVNIWATWCPPCREEVPSMVRLYEMFKGQGLEIVAVSEDTDPQAVAAFVRKYGVRFPVLLDHNRSVYQLYRATGVPETHLLDRKGVLQASWIGPFDWTGPKILGVVRGLLSR